MRVQIKKPPLVRTASEKAHANCKRFPAFGKQFDDLRKQGLIPAKRVIVAFDWSIGKLFPRIIITDDTPVTGLQFNYLAGLHVQVAYSDRNAAILPDLVNEILTVKPATLSVFNISAVSRGEPSFHTIHRSQSVSNPQLRNVAQLITEEVAA